MSDSLHVYNYRGNEMKIVLWGDRAVQFDAEAVRAMGLKSRL